MYIDNLRTPHQSVSGTDGTRPLAVAIGPEPLSAFPPTERLQRAAAVLLHVGRALRFPDREYAKNFGPNENTLDTLRLQVTNCIGYTIVGSEALRDTHYVVYANQHGFLGANDEKDRLHSLDALSPHLNGDISASTDLDTQQINDTIAQHGRAVVMVDARVFARQGYSYDVLVDKHPWLSAGNQGLDRAYTKSRDRIGRDNILVMSIYDGPTGRQVLESYVKFKHELASGRPLVAAYHLNQMSGLYPEVDARAKHSEIKTLVGRLCKIGEFSIAQQAVTDYCSGFEHVSDDPRLRALKAELLAKIANTSGDDIIAREAATLYEVAAKTSRSSWAPIAWLSRAQRLRSAA